MRNVAVLSWLLFVAGLTGCAAPQERLGPSGLPRGQITHVVCMRLYDAGDATARREVLAAGKTLEHLPGVISVAAGSTIKSDRAVVDHFYDVVFIFHFQSQADLDAYLANPVHAETKKDVLDRYVDKYVVYDFAAE